MLSVDRVVIPYGTPFTTEVVVLQHDPTMPEVLTYPITTTPVVNRSFKDPGVTVTARSGSVTISGSYREIIPIKWTYLDNDGNQQTSLTPPAQGTYTKVVKVDSPPMMNVDCVYVINDEPFVHTVVLGSYSTVATMLVTLLEGAK